MLMNWQNSYSQDLCYYFSPTWTNSYRKENQLFVLFICYIRCVEDSSHPWKQMQSTKEAKEQLSPFL